MTATRRLWILEDDPGIVVLYKTAFREEATGLYELSFFGHISGFMAAATGRAPRPALIIADLSLPDGDFADIYSSSARFTEATGLAVPVLIASGKTDIGPIRRLLQAGATDYITKPFPPAEILAKVERHLMDGKFTLAESAGFALDSQTLTMAAADGRRVGLTSKQFQIMMILWQAPQKAVSRDDIVRRVWAGVHVSPKNMNVHVSVLRQKLREIGLTIAFVAPQTYTLQEVSCDLKAG